MNKTLLMGNLVQDIKQNQSGKMAFSKIAVTGSERDEGGKYKTRFLPLRFIGEKTVESVSKNLAKGVKVAIDGETIIEDVKQDDGSYKTYAYILVRSWEFAQSKGDKKPEESSDGFENIPEGTDEELPFS